MRNISRRRNVALAAAVVGAGYLATFATVRIGPERAVLFGLAIASFITAIGGFSFFVFYQVTIRQRERLLRGERLLARWTLTEDLWSLFAAQQATWNDGTKNAITLRDDRSRQGVPVVITEEALMVEDDFHHLGDLRALTWHESAPSYFDFRMVTHTKSSAIHWHLRVPASQDDPPAMRRVWDYFQTRLTPEPMSARVRRARIMRRLSVVLILIGVAGALVAKWSTNDPALQTVMLVAMAAALIALPVGLLVGAVSHWWLTRGAGKAVTSA